MLRLAGRRLSSSVDPLPAAAAAAGTRSPLSAAAAGTRSPSPLPAAAATAGTCGPLAAAAFGGTRGPLAASHPGRNDHTRDRRDRFAIDSPFFTAARGYGTSSTEEDEDEDEEEEADEEDDCIFHCGAYRVGASTTLGDDGLPLRVDWRREGAVTPVQTQGECGSCWAHAVVASIEAINYQKCGTLVKLSEQQLIDGCDVNCNGCIGGTLVEAFEYVMETGVVPARNYPYMQRQGKFRNVKSHIVTISDYKIIKPGEYELKKAVALQPVAALIRADASYDGYKRGILRGRTYRWSEMDHAVCVVGYNTNRKGRGYFITKGSGGRFHGIGGYANLACAVYPKSGTLGLARHCVVPVKYGANKFGRVESESQMGVKIKKWKSWRGPDVQ